MTAGMVLAAGLGMRLRPLTLHMPKPAVPVLGVPAVLHALHGLAEAGIGLAAVNCQYLGEALEAVARRWARADLSLRFSHEDDLLGTAGGLGRALPLLEGAGEVVLINGDSVSEVDLLEVLAHHRARGADATMVLRPMPHSSSFAAVETDGEGWIVRIAGRPAVPPTAPVRAAIFTGVHVLGPRVLAALKPERSDINRDIYPRLLAAGARIAAYDHTGYWHDLGTPARLLAANLDALALRPARLLRRALAHGRWSGEGALASLLGGGVEVGSEVALETSCVGENCRLGKAARVRDSLLLTGAVVGPEAEIEGCILGPGVAVAAGARHSRQLLVAGEPPCPILAEPS